MNDLKGVDRRLVWEQFDLEIRMTIQRMVFGAAAAAPMLVFVQSSAKAETSPAKDFVATAIEAG